MSNFLVPPGTRNVFTDDDGNDDYDGASLQFPKKTLAAAVAKATALVPTISDPVAIIDIGASTFSENIDIPDNVFVLLNTIRLISPGGTAVKAGAAARGDFSSVQTSSTSGDIAYSSDDKSRVGFDSPSIVLNGENQIGISIDGTSTQIFTHISQILATTNNCVCFDYTSSGIPGSHTFDQFAVLGTDSIGIRHNSTENQPLEMRGGIIEAQGANNIGIQVLDGTAAVYVSHLEAPTAIHVGNGGTLNIFDADVIGDILIDAGGVLNCTINNLTGSITNNGEIHGRIENEIYGDETFLNSVTIAENLTVNGTLTTVDTENLIVADSYILTNSGYTTAVAKSGGLFTNYLPTATNDTVTAGAFVAGIDATSNPTVVTDTGDIFTDGDIIQISDSTENDGIYEVDDHTGTTLTVRGIGTVPTVEDFSQDQFTANASDNATITQVNVSIMSSGADGDWEIGKGATTPISFSNIPAVSDPVGSIQFNNAGAQDGDANFLYDDTLKTVVLQSEAAGSATYEFVDSSDDVKATIQYNESIDEFGIDVENGLSELHLNSTAFVHRGTIDGRIDIHAIANTGCALLTLSNFAGGTGLSLEHDDATDDSIISGEIGNITIQTASGTEDILINATGDISFGIKSYPKTIALEEGTYGNATSTNIILNKGDGGTNQSEFVLFNDSNASEIARYFRMGYVDEIATQGGLNISDANNYVSIGTRTDPDSPLHIYEDTTETGDQAGLTIEQDGTGDAITQYLLSGGQRWVTGIDNSGSDAFKIASSLDLASDARLVLETDGRSEFLGSLGVNILPASTMHVYEDTATTGAETGLTIEQDGAGDAVAQFLLTGSQRWVMGIDNSDSDNFVIAKSADLNSNRQLVLQDDGRNYFLGTLGVGQAPDAGYRLDVLTSISVHTRLSTFKAVTIESGKNGSGNSTDFFFNRGNVGFNQSEFTMFNDNNASGPARMFRMGYSDDIDTSGGLTVWKTRNNVAVGTYSLPDSVFTVSEDTTETGDQAGLTIIQEGTGDAIAQFLLDGGQRWVMGIDNSANDAFKISSSINLGSNDRFVLDPTDGAFIFSNTETGNVLTLGNSTGDISKITIDDAGSPEGVIIGTGGDDHINSDGALSTRSLKKSTASSTADWYDFNLVPPNLKNIYNTAELEAMATAGVITISASTTWTIKGHLDSDVRVAFTNNATLHIVTDNSNQSSWTYSGTGTMFSGEGRLRSLEFMDLISSSTGTFCNLELNGGSVNLTLAGVFGWDDLGAINNGTLILDVSDLFDNILGWDLFNCKITLTKSNITNTPTTALPFLTVDNSTAVESKSISVDQMSGTFVSGASLFRIEPALSDIPKNLISACIFGGGNLFDTSGSTGTFTVVADASVPAEAITSVSDSSGIARFNFAAPPTLFVHQEVVISGFAAAENLHYNGTWFITATGANYFEVASIDFGSDETGSFLSNSVTLTDTGTALVDGDQVTIDTDGSTDYDGGATVYNQLTNTFQVNRTWLATEIGTWSTEGLDQTDPRILAQANPGFADSKSSGFGHIEENPVANATIIGATDVYQAIDITGTTGSITIFATNGAGGTTCTSTAHGLVENQNVVLTAGDEYYRGSFTIFNVLTNTFDIAITFQATVLTSTWTSAFACDNERFKCTNTITGELTYIGNEPFDGSAKIIWAVNKVGSSQDYLFSAGKNGVSPEQGAPFQRRTVTTSTNVHPETTPVNLVFGDTVQPILASVDTTNSITVENLQLEIS